MTITLLLLEQIVVLFMMMMGLGYLLVKVKLAKSEDSRVLSLLHVYIIGPCVMIKSFQIEFTPEVLQGFLFAVVVAILINVLLLVLVSAIGKSLKLDPIERASVTYGNTGNLIIPLVMSVLGDEWLIYASAFMCVQLAFLWTHGYSLVGGQRGVSWKKILTNVNLIAIAAGLLLLLLGVRLPSPILILCDKFSNTTGPLNMVMLGMLLAKIKWREVLGNRRVYLVTFLKMICVPALILVLLKASGAVHMLADGKTILYISFMAVITPCATTVTQLAQLHRNRPEHASALNVATTLASLATMPLMTWLYMSWI
ncbi:MAG: AEC family transporter [Clostridia bacterium]|nr:AEC family transporter [Clostridia bacterium]